MGQGNPCGQHQAGLGTPCKIPASRFSDKGREFVLVGSGQILTQLRLRRALANCSGRFRDANLNPYDHLCEAGRA
jgi:hypothetical protein